MSNISNPTGPIGPSSPQRQNEPTKPKSEKFRDLMKIDKSPEKQKKKKKRQEEIEEEKKAEALKGGPASPEKHLESVKRGQKFPKVQKIGESEKKQSQHQKRSEETEFETVREAAAAQTQPKPTKPIETPPDTQQELTRPLVSKELDQIIEEEQQIVKQEASVEEFKQPLTKKKNIKKRQSDLLLHSHLQPLLLLAHPCCQLQKHPLPTPF